MALTDLILIAIWLPVALFSLLKLLSAQQVANQPMTNVFLYCIIASNFRLLSIFSSLYHTFSILYTYIYLYLHLYLPLSLSIHTHTQHPPPTQTQRDKSRPFPPIRPSAPLCVALIAIPALDLTPVASPTCSLWWISIPLLLHLFSVFHTHFRI